jgi:hypothetical protein
MLRLPPDTGSYYEQNGRESSKSVYRALIMKNIVNSATLRFYALLATPCPFCLLFRTRAGLAFLYPERLLAFEQSAFFPHGWALHCRLNCSKPGLPWRSRPNFRVASLGRRFCAGVVVPSQVRRLDTDIPFKP